MPGRVQMQARSSADQKLYSWSADAPDWAGAGFVTAGHPGTPLDVVKYATAGAATGAVMTCAITSPASGATVTQGATVTISGTVTQPASGVSVSVGGRTFAATIIGLTWSCSWPVDRQDAGSQTIGAVATATAGGTASASPVPVTVTPTTVSITAQTATLTGWIQDSLKYINHGTSPNAYVEHDVSARYELYTSDTTLAGFAVVYDIPSVLTIYVNGVKNQSFVFGGGTSTTKQAFSVTLPAGANKYIEIEEEGVSITDIGSSGCNISLVPYYAPRRRVIIYGTSIDVGYGVSVTFSKGWVQLLRHALGGTYGIINNSAPGAAFNDNNLNSGATSAWVASLASRIDGTIETVLFDDRETNDYGGASGGLWTASAYGAARTAAYVALHTAYPSLKIVHQTAITRTTPAEGTANTLGNTLADYRAASIAAASGLSYVSNVSGTAITGVVLADGLHPADAGHATIAAYEEANYWNPLP